MALILGIETTCDESAASVFTDRLEILSSVVASQTDLHAVFGGVVPEIASRAHLRQLLPVIKQAVRDANIQLHDLDAVAVAYTPGLIGAILIGLTTAKSLCLALDCPLLAVDHLQGHIFAGQLNRVEPIFPCVALVVSGGHTNLFHCPDAETFTPIGSTTDDAAGEAFDKVASLLGLEYPGGPSIEKAAKGGNPKAYDFPRTYLRDERLAFSFSGLKTAVLYGVFGQNAKGPRRTLTPSETADVAASFQQAVVEVLTAKCGQALDRYPVNTLCVGGGVAANSSLRQALKELALEKKVELVIPPMSLCTDNAAMMSVAARDYQHGRFASLDLDAISGLVRQPLPSK